MGSVTGASGFEKAFKLVGGSGRFQWFCLILSAWQLMMMTWNHLGYIFMGAVPEHWCEIEDLKLSGWTEEQVKNISIPKIYLGNEEKDFKYDKCHFYNIDYSRLIEISQGNFALAYDIVNDGNHELYNQVLDLSGDKLTSRKTKCVRWSYDKSLYSSTIVSEFDLVCGRRYLVASIQAFYMLGAFTGTVVFGPLNDKLLGRRNATLLGIVLVLVGGFLTSFSTSYIMFILMRFIVAIGTAGCMQASSVWFLEHCDTKSRGKLYCISGTFFGVGYAIMPVYAYYIRDWSTLQLAFSLTTISLLSFFWILPESPRWLASKGRETEAVAALMRIARINGLPKPLPSDLLEVVKKCHDDKEKNSIVLSDSGVGTEDKVTLEGGDGIGKPIHHEGEKQCSKTRLRRKNNSILRKVIGLIENFKSLCATKELMRISFTVWTLFIAVAFVYYGFAFTTNLTTNPYLLVSLGALMEVPASVLPIPFLGRWGRRPATALCFLLTGLSALSIAITPAQYESLRTIFSMIGKLFVASAFTVLYLVVSEVYPTVVRSTGQGAGTLMGRIGSISAPYVADMLTNVYPDLPCVIFGCVALAATVVALFLPEMKDVDMKDFISYHEKDDEEENRIS